MNNKLWNASLLLAFIKPMPIMVLASVLTIIGLFDLDIILLIGLILWILYFSVSLFCFLRMQYWINYRCNNEDFNNLMDELTNDTDNFLKKRIKEYDSILQTHGEELLKFSNGQLIDTVNTQTIAMITSEGINLVELNQSRKSVYILVSFDSEIMNGGLLQYFLNSTNEEIICVSECLDIVGAKEHKKLFDNYISGNGIDLLNLKDFDSYNYDEFNKSYYNLPSLNDILLEFIRSNIKEF